MEPGSTRVRFLWALRPRECVFAVAAIVMCLQGVGTASAQVSSHPSPSEFAVKVIRLLATNRYGDAWQFLVTAEKESIPRALYVGCERRTPIPGRLARIRALHSEQTGLTSIPGLTQPFVGYSVTLETTITGLPGGTSVTSHLIFYLVRDAHRFAWILHSDRYDAYRHGHCLQHGPPA